MQKVELNISTCTASNPTAASIEMWRKLPTLHPHLDVDSRLQGKKPGVEWLIRRRRRKSTERIPTDLSTGVENECVERKHVRVSPEKPTIFQALRRSLQLYHITHSLSTRLFTCVHNRHGSTTGSSVALRTARVVFYVATEQVKCNLVRPRAIKLHIGSKRGVSAALFNGSKDLKWAIKVGEMVSVAFRGPHWLH